MREPKYNIGDNVSVNANHLIGKDCYIKGFTYFGVEFGDKPELTGYDYVVAYQLDNGEWEWEDFSEDFVK